MSSSLVVFSCAASENDAAASNSRASNIRKTPLFHSALWIRFAASRSGNTPERSLCYFSSITKRSVTSQEGPAAEGSATRYMAARS